MPPFTRQFVTSHNRRAFRRRSRKPRRTFPKRVMTVVNRGREKKFFAVTTAASGTTLTDTPQVTDLLVPVQGDGNNQRVGDILELQQLEMRWEIRNNDVVVASTTVLSHSTISRIIVFQWHNPTVPIAADILGSVADVINTFSVYLLNPQEKFTILMDRNVRLVNPGPKIDGINEISIPARAGGHLKVFQKRLSKKVIFDTGAATGRNKIYIMTMTSATTLGPEFFFQSRILYTDS